MSASSQRWMDSVEAIAEEYADGDRFPDDFQGAMSRLIRMGLDKNEAQTILTEATA